MHALAAALATKVQKCKEELNSQEVGNALYGLQGLSDTKEARDFVAALTPKGLECHEDRDGQAVGNALYGLRSLGDSQTVRDLVEVLSLHPLVLARKELPYQLEKQLAQA